jgi:hypothetical protein
MIYIQRKGQGILETVDEFETQKEARAMIKEYRISDYSALYYLSHRACKAWVSEHLSTV